MIRLWPTPRPRQNPLSDPSKFRFDGQNWISRKFGRDIIAKAKPEVLSKMVRVQEQMGKPLTLTSGHRGPVKIDGKTYDHNKIAGGAPRSTHVPGMAMDVSSRGMTPDEAARFVNLASGEGFKSIQQYPGGNFHVDVGNPRQWTRARDPQVARAIQQHYAGNIPPSTYPPGSAAIAPQMMAQAMPQQSISPHPVTPSMPAPPYARGSAMGGTVSRSGHTSAPVSDFGRPAPPPVAAPQMPPQQMQLPAPSQQAAAPSQEMPMPGTTADKPDYQKLLALALMQAASGSQQGQPQPQPSHDGFMVPASPPGMFNPNPQGDIDPRLALIIQAMMANA